MSKSRFRFIGFFALIVFGLALPGCNLAENVFGGELIEQEREIDEFDQIDLRGAGTLIVTQGDTTSLEVTAREGLMDNIRTDVRGNTLRISY